MLFVLIYAYAVSGYHTDPAGLVDPVENIHVAFTLLAIACVAVVYIVRALFTETKGTPDREMGVFHCVAAGGRRATVGSAIQSAS